MIKRTRVSTGKPLTVANYLFFPGTISMISAPQESYCDPSKLTMKIISNGDSIFIEEKADTICEIHQTLTYAVEQLAEARVKRQEEFEKEQKAFNEERRRDRAISRARAAARSEENTLAQCN